MPFSIIATKLYPPLPADSFVPRHRLTERIQTGLNGRVTIVSAPPGFGKSTLLAAWIAQGGDVKTAWYSLDEDDNDPTRFFGYIAASLQTVEPDSVPTLSSTLEAGSTNPRELVTALLNDLSELASKNVAIVLDDYHHITQQPIHFQL